MDAEKSVGTYGGSEGQAALNYMLNKLVSNLTTVPAVPTAGILSQEIGIIKSEYV